MTGIIDYGAGNIFSVANALKYIGEKCLIITKAEDFKKCNRLILPGVGAFSDAVAKLKSSNLFEEIKHSALSNKPLLGICLGMQLLFDSGSEFEHCEGLSLINGNVVKINTQLKIPHMGWNALEEVNSSNLLLKGVENGSYMYFVHSYHAETDRENITAVCNYGGKVTACVSKSNVFGAQFHPEKSGQAGLKMLKNFCKI